jgi:Spy/CpxP family protein refolding chaperone
VRTVRFLPLLCALVVLLTFAPRAKAQQSTSPPSPASQPPPVASATRNQSDSEYPEADDSLNLTQDQKDRMKAIRDDAALQIQAAQKDSTLTEDQKERKIRLIRKQTRAKVFAVLTPEQQKLWAQNRREQRESKGKDPKAP